MNAWTIILDIVLILISIVLIIAVLLQQGQRQGLGAIAGGAETFFGKNKAKSYEAKMAKITKIGAAIFIVAAIAATIVAARTAPAANTSFDVAVCLISSISSGPAKRISCSPTIVPPRTECRPISFFARLRRCECLS